MSAPMSSQHIWHTKPGPPTSRAGRHSILLAPTNELVAQLNERARLDRLTTTAPSAITAEVTLIDGLTASAGDWITTRKNARWLPTTKHRTWVKTGTAGSFGLPLKT
jgi:hypothetical protein